MERVLHQSVISWSTKMFLRTLALVFMFLVRLRFPSRLSLLQVIRNRYGGTVVKLVRKFEKVDFKGALSGLKQFLATESPIKMMKNAFYFTSKALLVLKIFKYLS